MRGPSGGWKLDVRLIYSGSLHNISPQPLFARPASFMRCCQGILESFVDENGNPLPQDRVPPSDMDDPVLGKECSSLSDDGSCEDAAENANGQDPANLSPLRRRSTYTTPSGPLAEP